MFEAAARGQRSQGTRAARPGQGAVQRPRPAPLMPPNLTPLRPSLFFQAVICSIAQLLKLNRPIAQLLNSSTWRLLPSRLDPLSCPLAAFTTLTFSPAPAASSAHSHLPGTDTSSAVPHPVLLNGPLALPPAPTLSLLFLPFPTFSVVPYCLLVPNPMCQYCIISPSVPASALSVLASQHFPLFHFRDSVPADPSFPPPFAP